MTQRRLAKEVLFDKQITDHAKFELVSMWISEKRQMSFEHMRRICKSLDVDSNFLIGLTNEFSYRKYGR